MKRTYIISSNGLEESNSNDGVLHLYSGPSEDEKNIIIKEYDLPEDVFDFDDIPTVAPRLETIYNENLGDTLIFVFSNIVKVEEKTSVEERLESHTFILGQEKLFWFMNNKSATLNSELISLKGEKIDSMQSIILNAGLISYTNFTAELEKQKKLLII